MKTPYWLKENQSVPVSHNKSIKTISWRNNINSLPLLSKFLKIFKLPTAHIIVLFPTWFYGIKVVPWKCNLKEFYNHFIPCILHSLFHFICTAFSNLRMRKLKHWQTKCFMESHTELWSVGKGVARPEPGMDPGSSGSDDGSKHTWGLWRYADTVLSLSHQPW